MAQAFLCGAIHTAERHRDTHEQRHRQSHLIKGKGGGPCSLQRTRSTPGGRSRAEHRTVLLRSHEVPEHASSFKQEYRAPYREGITCRRAQRRKLRADSAVGLRPEESTRAEAEGQSGVDAKERQIVYRGCECSHDGAGAGVAGGATVAAGDPSVSVRASGGAVACAVTVALRAGRDA